MSDNVIALSRIRFDEIKAGDIFRFGQRIDDIDDPKIRVFRRESSFIHGRPYVLAWQRHYRRADPAIFPRDNYCEVMSLDSFRNGGAVRAQLGAFDPASPLADHMAYQIGWAASHADRLPKVVRLGSVFSEECRSAIPRIGDPMIKFDGKKCRSAKAWEIQLDGLGLKVGNGRFKLCYRQDNGFSRPVRRNERLFAKVMHD